MVLFWLTAVDIDKFLTRFTWDDSKYPRNGSLGDLIKGMEQVKSKFDI